MQGYFSKMGKTKTSPAKTVDEYLAALPEAQFAVLSKLRAAIKAAAPGAEEVISYQIPTYKQDGPVIHFAAFKNHCSLIPVGPDIIEALGDKLAGYNIKGYTLHFTPDNPLPDTLVKKIVKMRIARNKALAKKKTGK